LVYGGVIARAENRALVEELHVDLETAATVPWAQADAIALLDCQPASGNHSLPSDMIPNVVLDHHPLVGQLHASTLADIRPDYGATCTILTEYLEDARIHVDERLATSPLLRHQDRHAGPRSASSPTCACLSPPTNERSRESRIRACRTSTSERCTTPWSALLSMATPRLPNLATWSCRRRQVRRRI